MEGMPANKSMTELIMEAAFVPRKYSPVNKATGREKGRQNISAKKEVATVPTIKDNAPYCSSPLVGFHSGELINPQKPKVLNAGTAPLTNE